MKLSDEFLKFIDNYLSVESSRSLPDPNDSNDELTGLLADVSKFCGFDWSEANMKSFEIEPLDASVATQWLNRHCTKWDNDYDPEVWVASDFSFFCLVSTEGGFRFSVFIEPDGPVPTFEGWSLRFANS